MGSVVDIAGLTELRGISIVEGALRFGALTRWADIAVAALPSRFDGLRAAASQIGSVQVQNVGTLGGNLCNASPAADGIPPLLSLDASVELTSIAGSRLLPLEHFLTGYRQTALRPDELLTAVLIPRTAGDDARSAFLKLGLRRYLVISVVMVAVVVAHRSRRTDLRGEGLGRRVLAGGSPTANTRVVAGRPVDRRASTSPRSANISSRSARSTMSARRRTTGAGRRRNWCVARSRVAEAAR